MTVQQLINILSKVEDKSKPVYLFNNSEHLIEERITDFGDLEDRFELYIDW